jgi:hypothetical protein
MPDERKTLQFEFYIKRDLLKSLNTGQPFLIEDNTHPPPNATWWEQMGSYFWQWPPSYKVDTVMEKCRWEADDQRVLIRVEEFPDDTRKVVYRRKFEDWSANASYKSFRQPLQSIMQIMEKYLELIILAATLVIGWLFFKV